MLFPFPLYSFKYLTVTAVPVQPALVWGLHSLFCAADIYSQLTRSDTASSAFHRYCCLFCTWLSCFWVCMNAVRPCCLYDLDWCYLYFESVSFAWVSQYSGWLALQIQYLLNPSPNRQQYLTLGLHSTTPSLVCSRSPLQSHTMAQLQPFLTVLSVLALDLESGAFLR